jgi:hypothetical protein
MWIADQRMPALKVGILWKFRVLQVDVWVQAGNAGEKVRFE